MNDAIARLEALAVRPMFDDDPERADGAEVEDLRRVVVATLEALPAMTFYIMIQTPGEGHPPDQSPDDGDEGGDGGEGGDEGDGPKLDPPRPGRPQAPPA